MKTVLGMLLFFVLAVTTAHAQEKEIIETEFKVYGNCGMCKSRIEKAVNIDEVKYSKWNKEKKIMKVYFESSITLDSLQYRIAQAGHDTEKHKAPDSVYTALPDCCLYRDYNKTH